MHDNPTFLLGMPRSGTTWLSQLIEAHPSFLVRLSPNYSYPLKNKLNPSSTLNEWTEVLTEAIETTDEFMTQDWQRDAGNLIERPSEARATRLAIKDTRFHDTYLAGMRVLPDARTVYLVRNPCAVLYSWHRSPEFPADADWTQEWRTGTTRKREGDGEFWGFNDWMDITQRYLDLSALLPNRVFILRFESLMYELEPTLERLMDFLEAPVDQAMAEFARRSHGGHDPNPYSIHKDPNAVLDSWRGNLEETIEQAVAADLAGTELEQFLR